MRRRALEKYCEAVINEKMNMCIRCRFLQQSADSNVVRQSDLQPDLPRRSASPSQRHARELAKRRLIIGAEATQMRKAMAQRDRRHIGVIARTAKLFVNEPQPCLPQEVMGRRISPLAKTLLQRPDADAHRSRHIRHGDG